MVSLNFWSNASSKAVASTSESRDTLPQSHVDPQSVTDTVAPAASVAPSPTVEQPEDASTPAAVSETGPPTVEHPARRSFYGLRRHSDHKPMVTTEQERKKERQVPGELKHAVLLNVSSSRSDKRAKKSAEIVRSLIVGPKSISPVSKKTKPLSKTQMNKVKSDLAKPKSANKVIAQLRQLDLDSTPSTIAQPHSKGPIHAVCLDSSEEEIGKRHFSRLQADISPRDIDAEEFSPSIITATAESLASMFGDLRVVSLMSGDFGLGESGDGVGIMSGALPTAETIINGIEVITPQLMSLGFATGKAIMPDHKGVYPPTDRISVLTYWWGLEVVLPPPSLKYLDNAQSISHSVLNFLTVLAAVNNGVREILPFVRYISQFIEFEFSTIKGQNKGKGVVCAATWIMPAALVPRPWDFETPPTPAPTTLLANEDQTVSEPGSTEPSDESDPKTPAEDYPPFTIQPSESSGAKSNAPSPADVLLTPPTIGALSTPVLI